MLSSKDAYRHNSCKKLAQLEKVIYGYSSQIQDRNDELALISQEYEEEIEDIVYQHHQKMYGITRSLVQYRKSQINSSCQSFGSLYRTLKTNYTALYSSKKAELKELISQQRSLHKLLHTLQIQIVKDANLSIDQFDNFETETTRLKNFQISQSDISEAIQPILTKAATIKEASETKIHQMRKDHSSL